MFAIQPLTTDTSSVQASLDFVQKRCRARILTAGDVAGLAKESEDLLHIGFGVPRHLLVGTHAEIMTPSLSKGYNPLGKSGKATSLRLVRSREGWRVSHINREVCLRETGPNRRRLRLILPRSARQYLRNRIPDCDPPSRMPLSDSLQSAIWLGIIETNCRC
jgi:hypothetical protein